MRNLLLGSLTLILLAHGARAQLRLPSVPLLAKPLATLQQPVDALGAGAQDALSQVRRLQIGALLRANPRLIGVDPKGNPVVRGELLAYVGDAGLAAAIAGAGFTQLREQSLEALALRVTVLATPPGMSERRALRRLRDLDAKGTYDYNHIYLGSGGMEEDLGTAAPITPSEIPTLRAVRLGLIDTGIDQAHPAFRDARIRGWGCHGHPTGAAHGTAVASLMVGRAMPFQGVVPEAELYAADIYCGQATGGALDSLLAAFGWLAQARVPVINVSLVGPGNALLERAVEALVAQGFLLVAAVGNDGPAAAPLYPSAYAGVVGVSAVDPQRHALLEAARGPQVMFASAGADLAAAAGKEGFASVRGTSFAAPIVASLLAREMTSPDLGAAQSALSALARSASHPGKPGRDVTYGLGVVGMEYRIDPQILKQP